MGIDKAIILGIIQGLTEFLPVSSSGHLVLGQTFLNIPDQGITFEVFVHFGTLLSVLTVFRKDFINLVKSFFSLFLPTTYKGGLGTKYHTDIDFRLMIYIIIATIPAVVIGLLFEDKIESAFNDPRLVCGMLILTAGFLLLTLLAKNAKDDLSLKNTIIMGFAQALAIFPGISRSGSTISFGMLFKLDSNQAARFSFLMSIPAILGATILKVTEILDTGISSAQFFELSAGTIAAYISGYIAIESLLRIVRKGKLYWFAPYCLLLGILGLVFI